MMVDLFFHSFPVSSPAVQQSGKGGTFVLPTTNIVPPGGEFGSIPVGAPFFGQDVTNPNLCQYAFKLFRCIPFTSEHSTGYFNGTPAATAAFALDVIVPKHFGKPANEILDLVVSGPNEGTNNGPFLYTLSGTIGATYISVERGVSRKFRICQNTNIRIYRVVPCNCVFGRQQHSQIIYDEHWSEG